MENPAQPSQPAPPVRPKRKRRLWYSVFWVTGLLLFAVLLLGTIPFEMAWHLVTGWLTFLRQNAGQITFQPEKIIAGVIGILLATAGLHMLAVRWRRRSWPESPRWKWRWSAAVTTLILAASLAALAVAGIGHQLAWLQGEHSLELPMHHLRHQMPRQADKANVIVDDLLHFAEEHGGEFPQDLGELFFWSSRPRSGNLPSYFLDQWLFSPQRHHTPEPWLYFGAGRTTEIPADTLLLASPRPYRNERIIARAGGETNVLPEEDFQALLAKQPSQPEK